MNKDELSAYLLQCEKAKMHSCYRHYTTIEALAHIFHSKRFRFSCLSQVNDPIEQNRSNGIFAKTYYVGCFSHACKECIPLWRLYGQDNIGVCLEFDSLDFFTDVSRIHGLPQRWYIQKSDIIDVLYCNRDKKFSESQYLLGARIKKAGCIGFLKTRIWSYEEETRILYSVDSRIGIDDPYGFVFDGLDEPELNTPYIYYGLSNKHLQSIKIRFNPFMHESMKEVIKGGVLRLCPTFPIDNFHDSAIEGKIILK